MVEQMDKATQKELLEVLLKGSLVDLNNWYCNNINKLDNKTQLEIINLLNMEYYR